MELPVSQLALDPCMTKLHDSSTTTIALLHFLVGPIVADSEGAKCLTTEIYGSSTEIALVG